ncbi:periplasmic protein [Moraxella bovoculi 237]|uniref:Periplasmic protein n=1 Tax=Moraxella bovoculi 237 TaxID=743974 RepID=A0A066UKS4_9GAMM|nr:rhodanese-like domain-containing protein [Moraxella bovoculi]KDN24808.1 periplasmic protein [Moraxella bovoculi 237]
MKKLTLVIAISILGLTACNSFANTSSKQNNAKSQTQSQIKPKAKGVWIDVRSPEEYKAGHLLNSVNIPVGDIASKISAIEPNKNNPINLYCRSGRRAEVARTELLKLGYTNVTNHGGYEDLKQQGYR